MSRRFGAARAGHIHRAGRRTTTGRITAAAGPSRRSRPRRHRVRAALLGATLAAAVVASGIAVGGPAAQAAAPSHAAGQAPAAPPAGTVVTTVTTGGRSLTLAATPDSGLAPSGAQVTVAGRGFDPAHDLWVAVCQADDVAPKFLTHCIGGSIPDQNSTTGWGIVTDAKQPPYPGPVITRWQKDGSFELTLQLPSAIGDAVDCVSSPCSVFTRSSDESDRSEDAAVPIAFAAPPGESSPAGSSAASSAASSSAASQAPSTTAQPSTQTFGAVPTTVSPNSMLQTSVAVGGPQTVVFTGYTPGEKVTVTLYSDPVKLPDVTADPSGSVRISFTVPQDLPPGVHILQAIGTKSGRVGIARFTVTAPTTAASSSATSSGAASSSAAASSSPSAPSSAVAPVVTSAAATTAPSTSTAVSATPTATASSAAGAAAGGGNRLLWLWIALAVLVVVGGAAGVVVMVRSRHDREDDVPVTQATVTAPGWSAGPTGMPPTGPVPGAAGAPPEGGFGLLSGRDHPDGPGLYSGGGWPDRPTQAFDQPTQAIDQPTQVSDQPTRATGGAPPPAGPAEGPAGGPSTQQWRPDFTDEQPPADGDEPRGGGRHRTE